MKEMIFISHGVGFLRLGEGGLHVMLDHRVEGPLGGAAGAIDGTGGTYVGVGVKPDHRRAAREGDGAWEAISQSTGNPCAAPWLDQPWAATRAQY